MFNSTILDVAVGLAFTYLLLALVCTAINEWIASALETRGKMLLKGLEGMLQQDGTNLLTRFQAHPLISALSAKPGSPPSYIASRTFALAVMDLVTTQTSGPIGFADLQAGIGNLPAGQLKSALLAIIQNVHGDVTQAQARIEDWFNDSMDRVSGWYKRRSQLIAFCIAIALTVLVNADTLAIGKKLWISPTLRQQLVEASRQPQMQANSTVSAATQLETQLGGLMGWDGLAPGQMFAQIPGHLAGWFLTIVAVSLGAPFWFDTLNRIMSIRGAGKSPGEKG